MTGRIAAMSMDGTPVSEADVARMRAEEELHARWRQQTVRVIASAAHDASDCRLLISILGLDDDVAAARGTDRIRRPAKKARPRRRTHVAA